MHEVIVHAWHKQHELLSLFTPPQYAAIMQDPGIGRPIYIKVVRMIVEMGVVSWSAIFINHQLFIALFKNASNLEISK